MTIRKLAGALSVAAILALPAQAQEPMELTALDYIEIQQLVARYARAIDTCSNNGYDYADLYTPDGRFVPVINGRQGNGIQGRERLAAISGGGTNNCENVGWIEQGVHHIYVNHIITPTPEGATGTDLVLRVTEMLRAKGVVGKFLVFDSTGLYSPPLAARAKIANVAPESGATVSFFPVAQETLT